VTSIDVTPGASPTRSGFSNAGPWVTCSTIGTNVRSTFLHVNMALEESATDEVFNFESNSWATWNGTSFATPKVVAGVCAQLAGADGDPIKAWKNLAATGIDNSQAGLGLMFPQLG
jgi:subtilase family serine protease